MEQATYFRNNSVNELKSLLLNLTTGVKTWPKELNNFQKINYRFSESASKILKLIL